MSEAELNKRKREIFGRVGVKSLKRWLEEDQTAESIYDLIQNDENVNTNNIPQNLNILGNNLKDLKIQNNNHSDDSGKYLLLDLRSKEEYHKFHVREAICFPHFLINQDRFIPEIYR